MNEHVNKGGWGAGQKSPLQKLMDKSPLKIVHFPLVNDQIIIHYFYTYIDGDLKDQSSPIFLKKWDGGIDTKNEILERRIFPTFCSLLCSFIKYKFQKDHCLIV